jgi:5-methyltetrahydrofolate--homocysteine methyltransferase
MFERLVKAIVEMREEEAMASVKELLDKREDPLKIMEQCKKAVEIVGARFEKGEYFLPELIMAGHMLTEISNRVKPVLSKGLEVKRIGKVVMGTVAGDVHDIGKNIVIFLLDANGFEVIDIGIDVPAEKFVQAIRDFSPQVVGLSGLLTVAYDSMKKTVQAIERAGLRNKVKIIIGGAQVNDTIKEYAGADAYGKDAMAGVLLAKQWIGVK